MKRFISPEAMAFNKAHTQLNNYIKISIGSIEHLLQAYTNPKNLTDELSRLIRQSGERWTDRIINDPNKMLNIVKTDLAKSGIVWVYSAFDVYYKKTEGLLSTDFAASENDKHDDVEADTEGKKSTKIISLYSKLKWDLENISGLLPILKFYEVLRHCIAHNMGKASDKLIAIADSQDFKDSMQNWETKFKGKQISLPPIIDNERIVLMGHHAILYSETCMRIVRDIDQRYFSLRGLDYFIQRTIKKHLIDAKALSKPECSNYIRYIACHLESDYNVRLAKGQFEVYASYKDNQRKRKIDIARYTSFRRAR